MVRILVVVALLLPGPARCELLGQGGAPPAMDPRIGGGMRAEPATVPGTGEGCGEVLPGFRAHLLGVLGEAEVDLSRRARCASRTDRTPACRDLVAGTLARVERVRVLLRAVREEVARTWLDRLGEEDLVADCVDPGPGRSVLEANSRVLSLRPGARTSPACVALRNGWGGEVDRLVAATLGRPGDIGRVRERARQALLVELRSDLGRALEGGASAVWFNRGGHDPARVLADLGARYAGMAARVRALGDALRGLEDEELHAILAYRQAFARYVTELEPSHARRAVRCVEDQGILRDCLGSGRGKECRARVRGLLASTAPVLGMVEAWRDQPLARGAFESGLHSVEEYATRTAGNALDLLGGSLEVAGLPGVLRRSVGGVVAVALGRIAPSEAFLRGGGRELAEHLGDAAIEAGLEEVREGRGTTD